MDFTDEMRNELLKEYEQNLKNAEILLARAEAEVRVWKEVIDVIKGGH